MSNSSSQCEDKPGTTNITNATTINHANNVHMGSGDNVTWIKGITMS